MKTALRLAALLAALGLTAACGGSSSSTRANGNASETGAGGDGSDMVTGSITLEDSTPVVPALANGAGIGKCKVVHDEPNKMAAQCHNGTIAIIQDGKEVSYGCQNVTLDQCKAVFKYILDNTPVQ